MTFYWSAKEKDNHEKQKESNSRQSFHVTELNRNQVELHKPQKQLLLQHEAHSFPKETFSPVDK